MRRKVIFLAAPVFMAAFFIFSAPASLAIGEDIWIVSTGGESAFHALLDDDYNVTTKTADEIAASGIPSEIEL